MQIDLSGKVALVTGASGELGRPIARTLAACGADVAIHYFHARDRAEELAQELEGNGRRTCVVQADVGKEDEVLAMRDETVQALGAPDIIVNNAVVQYEWKYVLEQEVDAYRSQFESCVLQNVLMAKAFAPAMMEAGWGRIIAISTECAMQNSPNQSAYVSGKRGMDGVLRVLAKEIGGSQVTVNQVAPGWTISEGRPNDSGPGIEGYKERVPLRRRGQAQDIANAVAFLASDLAAFITGAFIPVCGGNVMPRI